jgi:hypothetical protein
MNTFLVEPEARAINYGPSTIYVNKLNIRFGDYQYNQTYLDVFVAALGDWWLDGQFKQSDVPYFNETKITLDSSVIDNWGTDDDVIVDAVFNHFNFTRKIN